MSVQRKLDSHLLVLKEVHLAHLSNLETNMIMLYAMFGGEEPDFSSPESPIALAKARQQEQMKKLEDEFQRETKVILERALGARSRLEMRVQGTEYGKIARNHLRLLRDFVLRSQAEANQDLMRYTRALKKAN